MTADKQKEFTRAKVEGLLKDAKFIYRVPSDMVSEFDKATTRTVANESFSIRKGFCSVTAPYKSLSVLNGSETLSQRV
jgi:hypothetical protein